MDHMDITLFIPQIGTPIQAGNTSAIYSRGTVQSIGDPSGRGDTTLGNQQQYFSVILLNLKPFSLHQSLQVRLAGISTSGPHTSPAGVECGSTGFSA
jgi:hypothetical protein